MAKRNELTKRQQQVLDFIVGWMSEKSYPPTVREIGDGIGLSSSSTVQAHLNRLEQKGYLKRSGSKSRSLELVSPARVPSTRSLSAVPPAPASSGPSKVIELPLVGRVAAGEPILAEQNIEDSFPLPVDIVGDSATFLLKVRGESMVEAGILDGDYVVVREQPTADNGDIVVAMIDEGATVKAFYREPDRIRLQPRNSSMEPIYSRDITVLGKVVALMRVL